LLHAGVVAAFSSMSVMLRAGGASKASPSVLPARAAVLPWREGRACGDGFARFLFYFFFSFSFEALTVATAGHPRDPGF
jgi:hypothetical protein